MDKKLQVFVSSTYTDLIEERQAAVEAIPNAGHIPVFPTFSECALHLPTDNAYTIKMVCVY